MKFHRVKKKFITYSDTHTDSQSMNGFLWILSIVCWLFFFFFSFFVCCQIFLDTCAEIDTSVFVGLISSCTANCTNLNFVSLSRCFSFLDFFFGAQFYSIVTCEYIYKAHTQTYTMVTMYRLKKNIHNTETTKTTTFITTTNE